MIVESLLFPLFLIIWIFCAWKKWRIPSICLGLALMLIPQMLTDIHYGYSETAYYRALITISEELKKNNTQEVIESIDEVYDSYNSEELYIGYRIIDKF